MTMRDSVFRTILFAILSFMISYLTSATITYNTINDGERLYELNNHYVGNVSDIMKWPDCAFINAGGYDGDIDHYGGLSDIEAYNPITENPYNGTVIMIDEFDQIEVTVYNDSDMDISNCNVSLTILEPASQIVLDLSEVGVN